MKRFLFLFCAWNVVAPVWAAEAVDLRHRLTLDFSNTIDFYDFEMENSPRFVDGTWLADTLHPRFTVHWDDRFRVGAGVVARRSYGDSRGYDDVDPWVQFLWQPSSRWQLIFGNIETPHRFHPALFMPLNYVRSSPTETGAQILYQKPRWLSDLYFNYRLEDTADHAEKFDLGFAHQNAWHFLRFHYQTHWVHEGGTLHRRNISTRNDVAQLFGAGAEVRPARRWILGGRYAYLSSHLRQDATRPDAPEPDPILNFTARGHGNLLEAYTRIARVKLSYEHWKGKNYDHEGSDPWFRLPKVHLASFQWIILSHPEVDLALKYTAGFAEDNDLAVARKMKSVIHLQGSWRFSIPLMEWTSTPRPEEEGDFPRHRWEDGV